MKEVNEIPVTFYFSFVARLKKDLFSLDQESGPQKTQHAMTELMEITRSNRVMLPANLGKVNAYGGKNKMTLKMRSRIIRIEKKKRE